MNTYKVLWIVPGPWVTSKKVSSFDNDDDHVTVFLVDCVSLRGL